MRHPAQEPLRADTHRRITGAADLALVLRGIEAAQQAGLTPIKTNTVLTRGVNDDEWAEIIEWTNARGIIPRFIEMMPQPRALPLRFPTCDELLRRFADRWERPIPQSANGIEGNGPARYYDIPGAGQVGLICSASSPTPS